MITDNRRSLDVAVTLNQMLRLMVGYCNKTLQEETLLDDDLQKLMVKIDQVAIQGIELTQTAIDCYAERTQVIGETGIEKRYFFHPEQQSTRKQVKQQFRQTRAMRRKRRHGGA